MLACVIHLFLFLSLGCCGSWSGVRPFAACLHGFGKAITFQTLISSFHLLQLACEIAFCCFNGRHLVRSLKSPPKGPIALKMLFLLCCHIMWCSFVYIHFQNRQKWIPPPLLFLGSWPSFLRMENYFYHPTPSAGVAFFPCIFQALILSWKI